MSQEWGFGEDVGIEEGIGGGGEGRKGCVSRDWG